MADTKEFDRLLIWAKYTICWHQNTENSVGITCDERGCAVCNEGPVSAAEHWAQVIMDGDIWPPREEEIQDAIRWWMDGGSDEWEEYIAV